LSESFDSRKFLGQWEKKKKDKSEWLFALAAVCVGLEREGNLDSKAEKEISTALRECEIPEKELDNYMRENRAEILRFLDSRPGSFF
jgi:hypothetical protein